MRVFSQVAERIKTYGLRQLGNIRETSKPHRSSLAFIFPPKMKISSILEKNSRKIEIQIFL